MSPSLKKKKVLTKPADGKAEDGKLAEIPIPEIRKVATYERDYRPHHRTSRTYLRNRTFGAPPTDVVEYDLDNEDEDWLTAYNDGQNRLPAEKFEAMIWKLEVCCGEATETAMELRAAVATEKGQIISYQDKCAAMAGTEALPKEKALELLKDMSGRPAIMEAVYDYWCAKRSRTGKPCLRRLQPPPAPNDANPFNVFRQREKTNRPQTRRRRENDASSFDKMRQIRKHMEMAYAVVELTLKREEKKLERCRSECDARALQIELKHEPRTKHEDIEAAYAAKPSCAPLGPGELGWDAAKPVTLPLSRVDVVMRADGTYGFGGERFAPPRETPGVPPPSSVWYMKCFPTGRSWSGSFWNDPPSLTLLCVLVDVNVKVSFISLPYLFSKTESYLISNTASRIPSAIIRFSANGRVHFESSLMIVTSFVS